MIPPVGYGVFLPDGKLEKYYINIEHLNYQTLCKENIDDQKIQALIEKSNSRGAIDARLIEAIKSHNLGLETTNLDNSFLAFWRVFEILAFGNRIDYNMNDVARRVCILIGANNDVIREFLLLCAERRNSLVHRGLSPKDNSALVLILKHYSALSIAQLLRLSKVYHDIESLDKYFEIAKSPTNDLLERKSIIENILAERNPKAK